MIRRMHRCTGRRPLGAQTARRRSARGPAKPVRPPPPNRFFSHSPSLAFALAAARALTVAMIAAPLALLSHGSLADEGGSSFWTPGSYVSLAATPSQPGFSLTSVYYHPSVSAGAEVVRAERIRIGRRSGLLFSDTNANSNASKDLAMVTPAYTFATPVLGGQANINLTAVYGRNSTSQFERVTDALLIGSFAFTRSAFDTISDQVTGFGDLAPQASLRWKAGVHNFMTYATGNIPVGAYNPARLSNIGIGHSALDGGVGYTYLDEAGREFWAVAGLTYNFINPSTQYQNGVDFHLDWAASPAASQFLSKQLQIGLVGYLYDQVTCDSGSGNQVGCFESRVASIGAQLGYTIPLGDLEAYVNVRGYKEFDAANRPEGWNVWLTFTISPADSPSTPALTRRVRQQSH